MDLRSGKRRNATQRDKVYGHGFGLRGIDLADQIASNTKIQKQRWTDIYRRLWERKAKVDIADSILIVDGIPRDWFFTSASTGEIQRKTSAHLTSIAIKKHFVRHSDTNAVVRTIAQLFHEDPHGDMAYSLLSDLDFNVVLGQASSSLWRTSFLLQPYLSTARQHPQYLGTFVSKFNACVTSSIRVLRIDSLFHELKHVVSPSGHAQLGYPSSSTTTSTRVNGTIPRAIEELIRMETTKIIQEIEGGVKERVKQLTLEFLITRTHRLVLVRVSRVVYFSDLQRKRQDTRGKASTRPASAGSVATNIKCTGGHYCHCKANATGEVNKTSTALSKSNEWQQITRKSLRLCEEESEFLEAFGANAEAKLTSTSATILSLRAGPQMQDEAFKRLLQRRIFMLRSTLWNPESESFNAKPLAWEEEKKMQPQQYEMVRVCRACYLIYHTMDAERFQATKSTVKAAARRLNLIHNAKLMEESPKVRKTEAWNDENEVHSEHE
ncbi:hypothetical protein Poli38472_000390 [Pythium oligandrum]|uniref:Uncharacterized protein n=1 Tax=Pythium oligandrum TaxID=41045 RepID=A0A8K1CC87_PYTOL|nr:hypothetical protein Poli38472_000390 [Pythium oligandrum]|eukprot:TMW60348.1 hypothetical protein Poli38472_000390 [Pythium oligandrum]